MLLGTPLDLRSINQAPVHVAGAGISGLLLAYHLKRAGYKVIVYEASSVAGGLLGTDTGAYGSADRAANGFIWCPEIGAMCNELNLTIQPPLPTARARYIVRNGQLTRNPLHFTEWVATGWHLLKTQRRVLPTTVQEFGHRYLGTAFTQQVLSPALGGIYGASLDRLSLEATLPVIAHSLRQSSWLPLGWYRYRRQQHKAASASGPRGTHSLSGGMKTLVEAIARYLGPQLRCNYPIEALPDGHTVLCMPAGSAATLFAQGSPIRSLLEQVEYLPIVRSTLIFKRSQLPRFQSGFGCLIPPHEGFHSIGVLFNSSVFPGRVIDTDQYVSLSCIMRDDTSEKNLLHLPDSNLLQLMCSDLHRLFGLVGEPIEYFIYRWPQAFPAYTPTLAASWPQLDRLLREHHPHIRLFANYTGHISLRALCQQAAACTIHT